MNISVTLAGRSGFASEAKKTGHPLLVCLRERNELVAACMSSTLRRHRDFRSILEIAFAVVSAWPGGRHVDTQASALETLAACEMPRRELT